MITLDDLRGFATALPEAIEGTHFRLPAFKVRDKVFVTVQQGGTHAILHTGREEAEAAASEDPGAYEVVWRGERVFVGVRVDLARAPAGRVHDLVEAAWRNRAPKRLVAAHEG